MPLAIGQGSGDFRETSGRVQPFHIGCRNSVGILVPTAFTQDNPPVVTATANVSTTLSGITRKGVLGATFAFTRPDIGNGMIGGPALITAAYQAGQKPLGVFINDALGNAYENTPAVASGRGPYYSGMSVLGFSLWETQIQVGASTALTYAVGDALYASPNGLLTNRLEDAYQYNVAAQNDRDFVTIVGVLKIVPDANNSLMVVDMRI